MTLRVSPAGKIGILYLLIANVLGYNIVCKEKNPSCKMQLKRIKQNQPSQLLRNKQANTCLQYYNEDYVLYST